MTFSPHTRNSHLKHIKPTVNDIEADLKYRRKLDCISPSKPLIMKPSSHKKHKSLLNSFLSSSERYGINSSKVDDLINSAQHQFELQLNKLDNNQSNAGASSYYRNNFSPNASLLTTGNRVPSAKTLKDSASNTDRTKFKLRNTSRQGEQIQKPIPPPLDFTTEDNKLLNFAIKTNQTPTYRLGSNLMSKRVSSANLSTKRPATAQGYLISDSKSRDSRNPNSKQGPSFQPKEPTDPTGIRTHLPLHNNSVDVDPPSAYKDPVLVPILKPPPATPHIAIAGSVHFQLPPDSKDNTLYDDNTSRILRPPNVAAKSKNSPQQKKLANSPPEPANLTE